MSRFSSSQLKIIIFGHQGFVGSYCYQSLKNIFHSKVIGFSSKGLDLTNPSSVRKLIRLFDSNTVVLFLSAITREERDDLTSFAMNMSMVDHVAQALERKRIKKFIFMSTISVYGEALKQGLISQNTDPKPDSLYGLAKFHGEFLIKKACAKQKTPYLILRMPRVYGAGDEKAKYGPSQFVRTAVLEKKVVLYGDGKEKRAFLFIEDIIDLLLDNIVNKSQGLVNFVPSTTHSYDEVVRLIKELVPALRVQHRLQTNPTRNEKFDNHLFRKTFPGFIFTPLKEGITKTYHQQIGLNQSSWQKSIY